MTALFLVVLMATRGLTGTDHVDGGSAERHAIPRYFISSRSRPDARGDRAGAHRRAHHTAKLLLSIAATVVLLAVSVTLLVGAGSGTDALTSTYRLGDCPPRRHRVVGDRLAFMMVTLAGTLALAAITFSQPAGIGPPSLPTLFQWLLMG